MVDDIGMPNEGCQIGFWSLNLGLLTFKTFGTWTVDKKIGWHGEGEAPQIDHGDPTDYGHHHGLAMVHSSSSLFNYSYHCFSLEPARLYY